MTSTTPTPIANPSAQIRCADGRLILANAADQLWPVRSIGCRRVQPYTVEQLALLLAERPDIRHSVPVPPAVQRRTAILPIPPYALGVLLGDGSLRSGSIRYSKPAQSVAAAMRRSLARSPWCLGAQYADGRSYGVLPRVRGAGPSLSTVLDRLDLLGRRAWEKHIPARYLIGSIAQRSELLRGLLDTDGSASKSGSISFWTTSAQLATDVQTLVWSLGGIALLRQKQTFCTYKGVRTAGRPSYKIYIRHLRPRELFRNEAKQVRVPAVYHLAELRVDVQGVEFAG